MLKKVLKYDLKFIYKILLVFYLLGVGCALATRIFWSFDNSAIFKILGDITSGATIAFVINILVNNLMRSWVRFINNVYKDESYLTHTLPVDKKTIYLSKFLSTLISVFTSVVVILLSLFIAYYSKENLELVKSSLQGIAFVYNSSVIKLLLLIAIVFFVEVAYIIQVGNTGIIIGHKSNNNKIAKSIIWGFAIYTMTSMVLLAILFIIGLLNKDIMNFFITNNEININMVKYIMYSAVIVYSVLIAIFYIIDIKLFKKGVNVE